MLRAGDVVLVDFPGAHVTKRRPAVVLSSEAYHLSRPDVVLAVLTSNTTRANTALDRVLADWQLANLLKPTAFRPYFVTVEQSAVRAIGRLSERDWLGVRQSVQSALDVQGDT